MEAAISYPVGPLTWPPPRSYTQGDSGSQGGMRIVVIAGQARKVGKTSVTTALIRATRRLSWVAVKISTHEGGTLRGGEPAGGHDKGAPTFVLTEETEASPCTDTGRYLAAGARRAFWLRARPEGLKAGVAALLSSIPNEKNVMIESGSVLSILKPEATILVVDRKRREVKPSFRRALARADAVVEVVPATAGPIYHPRPAFGVRWFAVTRRKWSNQDLSKLVLQRIRHMEDL